jgi:ClpP class serine protease
VENKEKDLEETLEDMDLERQLAMAIKERDHANDTLEWRTSERNQLDEENKDLHEELKRAVKENDRLRIALQEILTERGKLTDMSLADTERIAEIAIEALDRGQ